MARSIWGQGERITYRAIQRLPKGGRWLDLAAGDGRYAPELLRKANRLVLADKDRTAIRATARRLRSPRISVRAIDLRKRHPFAGASFDGVLCTGTLHLLRPAIVKRALCETDRVLRPGGFLVLDFATETQRRYPGGPWARTPGEPRYTREKAERLLRGTLRGYFVTLRHARYSDDVRRVPGLGYKGRGRFTLLAARKPLLSPRAKRKKR